MEEAKKGRVTQFIKDLRLDTLSIPEQFNKWLTGLSTVQFQALISAMLAGGTAIVYWITMLKTIKVDPVNFGMWLGFVAAYGGIAYRQFKTKRETYNPDIPSKQNLQTPPATSGEAIG